MKKIAKGQFHLRGVLICLACDRERKYSSIFTFSLSIDSEMVGVAIQMPIHLRRLIMFTEALGRGGKKKKRQKDFTYTYLLGWSSFLEIIDT